MSDNRTILLGLAALFALGCSLRFGFFIVLVRGPSMLPTLRAGDRLLARRCLRQPRVGSLVVLERPLVDRSDRLGRSGRVREAVPQPKWIVKRLVAVAGDPVPAWCFSVLDSTERDLRQIPAGMMLVLGDNLAESYDSRDFGFVSLTKLRGVVMPAVRIRQR